MDPSNITNVSLARVLLLPPAIFGRYLPSPLLISKINIVSSLIARKAQLFQCVVSKLQVTTLASLVTLVKAGNSFSRISYSC